MYRVKEQKDGSTVIFDKISGKKVCIVDPPELSEPLPFHLIIMNSMKDEHPSLPIATSPLTSSPSPSKGEDDEEFSINIPLLSKQTKTFFDTIKCKGCQKSFPCSYGGKRTTPSPEYYIHCIQKCEKYKALGLVRECLKCKSKFLSQQALGTHQKGCNYTEMRSSGKQNKKKKKASSSFSVSSAASLVAKTADLSKTIASTSVTLSVSRDAVEEMDGDDQDGEEMRSDAIQALLDGIQAEVEINEVEEYDDSEKRFVEKETQKSFEDGRESNGNQSEAADFTTNDHDSDGIDLVAESVALDVELIEEKPAPKGKGKVKKSIPVSLPPQSQVAIPLESKRTKHFTSSIKCKGCQRSFPCHYWGKRTAPSPEYYIHCIEKCQKYIALGLISDCVKCRLRFLNKRALISHQKVCDRISARNIVKAKKKTSTKSFAFTSQPTSSSTTSSGNHKSHNKSNGKHPQPQFAFKGVQNKSRKLKSSSAKLQSVPSFAPIRVPKCMPSSRFVKKQPSSLKSPKGAKGMKCLRKGAGNLTSNQQKQRHKELICRLRAEGILKSEAVYEAMLSVDLRNFYDLKQAHDWSMVSDIAVSLDKAAFYVKAGHDILDIALTWYSLYELVCLALMVGPTGSILSFTNASQERETERVTKQIKVDHSFLLDEGRFKIKVEPDPEQMRREFTLSAPYDLIIADDLFEAKFAVDKLKPGGKLLTPFFDPFNC